MHRWSRPSTKGGTDHLPSPNRVRNRAYLWPLAKFAPQIRNWRDRDLSVFRASHGQLFPFLAMDVKCGQVGLDLADRQNAHSSAIAARAIVSFFRIAGREKDLHRRIVCWSISHNNRSVLIYGYYTVIDSEHTSYYTHLHNGHFISPQITNETRWTSYKFVKNLYEKWVPDHLDKVRSLLDGLPYPPVQPTSDRRFQAGGARDVKTGGGGRSAGQPPSRTKKKKNTSLKCSRLAFYTHMSSCRHHLNIVPIMIYLIVTRPEQLLRKRQPHAEKGKSSRPGPLASLVVVLARGGPARLPKKRTAPPQRNERSGSGAVLLTDFHSAVDLARLSRLDVLLRIGMVLDVGLQVDVADEADAAAGLDAPEHAALGARRARQPVDVFLVSGAKCPKRT